MNDIQDVVEKIKEGVYKPLPKYGKSIAWYCLFEIAKEDGSILDGLVYCDICHKCLKYSKLQTSNLLRHKCVHIAKRQRSMTGQTDNEMENKRIHPVLREIANKVEKGKLILYDKPITKGMSLVWSVFCRLQDLNGETLPNYVFCKTCRKAFTYMNVTTNLSRHWCYQVFIKAQQTVSLVKDEKPTITDNQNTYTPFSNDNLTNLLTKCLVKECQTFDLLQSESLKAIFKELLVIGSTFGDNINIEDLIPSPSEARKTLSEMHQRCFERVFEEICSIEERGLGLTSAIWRDSFTDKDYIVLTAHYIQNETLQTRYLGLGTFEIAQNTAQTILHKISEILEEFGCKLSSKSIIVTDFSAKFLDTSQDVQNLPCLSRLLSDAILQSIEQVPEVKEIVNACFRIRDYLIKIEDETLLNDMLNDTYCNPWLRKYKIINLIKEKWIYIEEVLQSLNEESLTSSISINDVEAVVKALQPFEEAIQTLENDSSPTLHLVIVYLHELNKSCDTSLSEFEDLDLIKDLKEKLRIQLQKIIMQDVKTLHKIALFLYPPTNKLIQFNDDEKLIIENECLRLMQNYKQEENSSGNQNLDSDSAPSSAKKRKSIFSDFITTNNTQNSPCDHFNREMKLYKLFDAVYDDNFDVLNWWQTHRQNFPYLYKLSCLVLATPATCVASQKVLLTRKSIQTTTGMGLEKILFLNANKVEDDLDDCNVVV